MSLAAVNKYGGYGADFSNMSPVELCIPLNERGGCWKFKAFNEDPYRGICRDWTLGHWPDCTLKQKECAFPGNIAQPP